MAEENKNLRYRDATITQSDSNGEYLGVTLSTEQPVKVYDERGNPYYEVLDYSERAEVDLSRFNPTIPLLDSHRKELTDILGRVGNPRLEERTLKADIKLGETARGRHIQEQIDTGNLTSLSIAYIPSKERREGTHKGLPLIRAMAHDIWETSLVSIPANVEAKIRNLSTTNEVTAMVDEVKSEDSSENKTPVVKVEQRQLNQRELIMQFAGQASSANPLALPLAQRRLQEDKDLTLETYFEELGEATKKRNQEHNPIGLTKSDKQNFSFVKLINSIGNPTERTLQDAAKMEVEVCQEQAKLEDPSVRALGGLTIPSQLLTHKKRELDTSNVTETQQGGLVEFLQDSSKLLPRVTTVNRTEGELELPNVSASGGVKFLANKPTVDDVVNEMEFGAPIQFPQKSLVGRQVFSRQSLMTAGEDLEALVRQDISDSYGLVVDQQIALGNLPSGFDGCFGKNDPDLRVGAQGDKKIKWVDLVNLESLMAGKNALRGTPIYLTSSNVIGAMKAREKVAGTGIFLAETLGTMTPGGMLQTVSNGYEVLPMASFPSTFNSATATTGGTGNLLMLLVPRDYAFVVWGGGLTLFTNPYLLADRRQIIVHASALVSGNLRHKQSCAYLWGVSAAV